MTDFIQYVVSELKSGRLSRQDALSLIGQFWRRPATPGASALHPLLHANVSTLGEQRYASWFGGDEFLSIARMLAEWRVLTEMARAGEFDSHESSPGAGVKAGWWRPGWLPFTADGAGNHLCLDLDPAPDGRAGQVIEFDHEFGRRNVHAPGFAQWFADFTRATVAQDQEGDEE